MKNILIIKHGSLGDIISATSVLKDIRDHYINDKIIILTTNKFKNFFLESPFVNNVLVDNREGLVKSLIILSKIIKLKVDLIIDLQNTRRTNLYEFLFRLFTIAEINGTGIFATKRYKNIYSELPSVVDGLSNQIEKLGIKTTRTPFLEWLMNKPFDWSKISNKRFMIINPGCSINNDQKKWSEKKYAEICDFLNSKNILPILIGSVIDKESIDFINKNTTNVVNLCNQSPLNVVYQISKKAIGAISNDTGPAHLIAASGCKIHLVLSSFSNVYTVIPKTPNVTFTQKNNINEISSEEIIKEIKKNMIYEY